MNMNCNKNDECEQVIQAPQEFLDYWFFPEGSWWVYQNQNGEIDTAICTRSDSFFYQLNDHHGVPPYCKWIYQSLLKHSNDTYFRKKHQEDIQELYSVNSLDNKCFLIVTSYSWYLPYGALLVYPFKISDTIDYKKFSWGKQFNYISDTSSIEVNKIVFNHVIHVIKYREGVLPEIFLNEIWFSKYIGIVKMSFANGNYWELIDYKINK